MIYEALVIDNADFATKGTIRVRIRQLAITPALTKDLSVDPEKSIDTYGNQEWVERNGEKVFTYTDTDVKVSSMFGGGYDYGVFYLPQPNSWGIVGRIGDPWNESSRSDFVWLGALYQRDSLNGDINIPSQEFTTKKNGVENGNENLNNFSSTLVIKTKTTKIKNSAKDIKQADSQKSLDWKQRPTENMIIIDKDKISIQHNILNDKDESVAMETMRLDSDGFIVNYYDKQNSLNSYFKLRDNGNFEINKEAKDANITLSGNENGVNVDYMDDKNDGANLVLGKKNGVSGGDNKTEATISSYENGKNACTVSVKSTGIVIESGGDVQISAAGSVTLGRSGLPVLCSPNGEDVEVGNVTLVASPNVFG